jgi:cytochrome oxidase Cu insertion factor (SCO1/SenC/PrrC family)
MHSKILFPGSIFTVVLTSLLLSACSSSATPGIPATVPATSAQHAVPTVVPTPSRPDWFAIPLTDARTGETFTINDFAGKVVLIQTIAQWCTNCAYQQDEVRTLSKLLDNPDGLVSISLDVDAHEDQASLKSLKKYVDYFGFDWHFAIAPLEVDRALGNLYSAEYLNPPLEPMLFIDRNGKVYGLPYGMKTAQQLKNTLAPYLSQ